MSYQIMNWKQQNEAMCKLRMARKIARKRYLKKYKEDKKNEQASK